MACWCTKYFLYTPKPIYVYTNISNNQFRSDADDDESAAAATATATENGLSGRPLLKNKTH